MSGFNLKENVIPAAEWITVIKPLIDNGYNFKLHPMGTSMLPFICGGRDDVLLTSAENRKLKRGDIVLYSRPTGLFVLHRIHHIRGNLFFMLGDAHTSIEGPISRNCIYAVAASVTRKGKEYHCDDILMHFLALSWLLARPFRPYLFYIKNFLWKHLKRTTKDNTSL